MNLLDRFLSTNDPDNQNSLNGLLIVLVSLVSKHEENTYFSLKQLLKLLKHIDFQIDDINKFEHCVFK